MTRLRGDADKGASSKDKDHDNASSNSMPESLSKARRIALVATVTGAAFVNSVVIILPTIGRELNVPESRQQWVVSSYSLAFGCFLLLWGRVADMYGKRLIFILGSAWVTIMTVVNPLVSHEVAFDIIRALHGLVSLAYPTPNAPSDLVSMLQGAAANVPTAIGILGVTFPPGKAKNYAFSTYAAGAPLGSVSGNLLSGFIAQYSNWKWVFGATAVMACSVSIAGYLFIPSSVQAAPISQQPAIDWIGAFLITSGLVALMFALTEGNVVGWQTPWVPVTIVSSLLVVLGFVLWQLRLERRHDPHRPPLVKMSMFRNLRFGAVMAIMFLFFASFNNYLIYATYFFQDFQHLSPLQTMLRFIPSGAAGAIIALIVAQLLGRIPTFFILVCGNMAVSLASLLFALPLPPTTSYFAFGLPAMLLAVVGADTTWPCLTLFISQALPSEHQAVGGALINAVGQLGRAFGLAISTAVHTAVLASARRVSVNDAGPLRPWDPNSLHALRAANWVNCVFGLASLFVVIVALRSMDIVGKPTPPRPYDVSHGPEHLPAVSPHKTSDPQPPLQCRQSAA
ncbi:hypothetical protein CDD82_7311 [Ophiocordyceps australis]|uniref:Major facilitator superfamily (MFS) profile domain-containing protein n=1 Tax=Ophiocordyceps australis TaxID=1399860 RepID=A0A2C5YSY4_9HYPO|nr:hypothetical protein CDD82_7311 [Ophiocordyceps australis]